MKRFRADTWRNAFGTAPAVHSNSAASAQAWDGRPTISGSGTLELQDLELWARLLGSFCPAQEGAHSQRFMWPPTPIGSLLWLFLMVHKNNSGELPALLELPLTKFGFAFYLELPPAAAERRKKNLQYKETSVRIILGWEWSDMWYQSYMWPLLTGWHDTCKGTSLGHCIFQGKPNTISIIISQWH